MKENIIAHYHPGIYQIQLPFLVDLHSPNERGLIPTEKCDIEIHVRNKLDSNLVTVLISTIKDGLSPTNYILDVATILLNEYLPRLIDTKELHSKVRWIQREDYPEERFNEVKFSWNKNLRRLQNPGWYPIEDDWIKKEHKLPKY